MIRGNDIINWYIAIYPGYNIVIITYKRHIFCSYFKLILPLKKIRLLIIITIKTKYDCNLIKLIKA